MKQGSGNEPSIPGSLSLPFMRQSAPLYEDPWQVDTVTQATQFVVALRLGAKPRPLVVG